MTAPSAAPPQPPNRRPAGGRPASRRTRALSAAAAVLLIGPAAAGCVTVHGATAVVPSVTTGRARSVTAAFLRAENTAQSRLDASVTQRTESGPLLAVDGSYVRAAHTAKVDTSHYVPLKAAATRVLIPRQAGWPKWFVSDVTLTDGTHRLLVFTHDDPRQAWTCSYLLAVSAAQAPRFATDASGHAEPVPAAGTSLAAQPGRLARGYADFLDGRDTPTTFADGSYTSGLVAARRAGEQQVARGGGVQQYADEADGQRRFGPVALRLKDGGAFVFFTTEYQSQVTGSTHAPQVVPVIRAMLTGRIRRRVTVYYVSIVGARVPVSNAPGGARVEVVARLAAAVKAKGS